MNRYIALIVLILLALTACRRQPDGILSEDEMVALLVDVHKTEAVMTLNHSKYPGDSKKRAMREAVFMRHNTSQAQFDSSLAWYGHNIGTYMDVYDRVIEQLKSENEEVKALIAQDDVQTLTMAGDSVDIWKQQRWHIFNADKGQNIMAFNINTDENFQRNDCFVLRYHVVNRPHSGEKPRAYLAIRHNNHNIHYNYANVEREGWNTLQVQSDSANNISEVYGYVAMSPRHDRHIMYIDSIELMRIHFRPGMKRYDYHIIETNPVRKNYNTAKQRVTNHKPSDRLPKLEHKVMNKK